MNGWDGETIILFLSLQMLLIQTTTHHESSEDKKQSVHEDTKTFTPFHLLPSPTAH